MLLVLFLSFVHQKCSESDIIQSSHTAKLSSTIIRQSEGMYQFAGCLFSLVYFCVCVFFLLNFVVLLCINNLKKILVFAVIAPLKICHIVRRVD